VQEVKVVDNKISVNLSVTALEIFKWDDVDTTFFKINTERNEVIAGDLMLSTPSMPISVEQGNRV
jgi:two-component system sensor histidine kinase TctE